MKKICLFLCFSTFLYASNLLTYNVYERNDRIDLMLSFDAPYEGQIFQQKGKNIISITLNDLIYDSLVEKSINSPILQDLIIDASENSTIVTFKSKNSMAVYASKTKDGFGLRIRVKPMAPPISVAKPPSKSEDVLSSTIIDARYLSVIGVMILLLVVLYWIKWKIKKIRISPKKTKKTKSWLFKNDPGDIQIISQKMLDNQNKIALVTYKNRQYLILTGSTNIMLDKFGEDGISIQDDNEFQAIFEQNRQKLDNYLKLQQANQLKSYKEKASQDFVIK